MQSDSDSEVVNKVYTIAVPQRDCAAPAEKAPRGSGSSGAANEHSGNIAARISIRTELQNERKTGQESVGLGLPIVSVR